MERDSDTDPEIDMTAPGSDTDQADGSASQMPYDDTLEPHVTDDILDEGYSPPDRRPAVDIPTPAEERAGEGLARRLAEEEPDDAPDEQDGEPSGGRSAAGDRRSGRLTADDGDGDNDDDVLAEDAGIAGGAASGEEAAMHIVDDEAGE